MGLYNIVNKNYLKMENSMKKFIIYLLSAVVALVSVYSLLAVWEIVTPPENLMLKAFQSAIVIVIAGALMAFLFSFINGDKKKKNKNPEDYEPKF